MPKYDLAGNPLPEPNAPPAVPPMPGLPPRGPAPALPPRTDAQGRPIYAAPPPAAPEGAVRYDLAGNPLPQAAAPQPPAAGAWTPPPQPGAWPPPPAAPGQYANPYAMPAARNTSGGQGDVPPEIARLKWNWGACGVPFFWCWYHNLKYLTIMWLVLFFVNPILRILPADQQSVIGVVLPLANFALLLYLGFAGNKIAWRNRVFPGGVAEFFQVQQAWMIWGILVFILNVLAVAAAIALPIYLKALLQPMMNGHAGGYSIPYGNGSGNRGFAPSGSGSTGGQ